MKYLVVISFLLVLLSCERELPIDDADFTKKLVVNTFLEADSNFIIHLSSSVNTLSDPKIILLNGQAQVLLKNEEIPIFNSLVNVVNGRIELPLFCLKNTRYTLELSYEDYAPIRATDVVPVASPRISVDTLIDNGKKYTMLFTLKDSSIANKYFIQLLSLGKQIRGTDTSLINKPLKFSTTDRLFFSNILTYNNTSSYALFDDDLLNGSTRQFEIKIDKAALYELNYIPEHVVLQVSCVSENMYSYYVNLLENTQIYGGPLSSVSRQNGNVDQGLGAFCFYTASRGSAIIR